MLANIFYAPGFQLSTGQLLFPVVGWGCSNTYIDKGVGWLMSLLPPGTWEMNHQWTRLFHGKAPGWLVGWLVHGRA